MRGRSHRIPSNEPADEWGEEESWTVDCVCGVNFDDGEEMVNCDVCGVWVHTRCSRFVKGDTSFACDKCKTTHTHTHTHTHTNNNDNDHEEETEVAQLLVELPTKTIRLPFSSPSSAPPHRPRRLWTDMPIHQRVHVQGLPGGDPSFFQGFSSVFTSDLWKCAGYVPKNFNFHYKEFPCWDDNHPVDTDTGADALFSLSKQVLSPTPTPTPTPVDMLVGLRDNGAPQIKTKEMKKRSHNHPKRDKTHPFGIRFGKHNKDDVRQTKDLALTANNKATKNVDKEVDSKKKAPSPAIHARKTDFPNDGEIKFQELDDGGPISKRGTKRQGHHTYQVMKERCKPNQDVAANAQPDEVTNTHPAEVSSKETSGHGLPITTLRLQTPNHTEASPSTIPLLDQYPVVTLINQEDYNMVIDGSNHFNDEKNEEGDLHRKSSTVAMDSQKLKSPSRSSRSAASSVQDSQILHDSNGSMSTNSFQPDLEAEAEGNKPNRDLDLPTSTLIDVKLDGDKHLDQHQEITVSTYSSENLEVNEKCVVGFSSCDHKAKDATPESEAVRYCCKGNNVEGISSVSGEPKKGQELKGSAGAFSGEGSSSELKHGTRHVEASTKTEGMKPSKAVLGKSSSTSSTVIISKSTVAGGCKPPGRPASSNTLKLIHSTKHRVKVNSFADSKKDHTMIDVVRDDSRHEISGKNGREQSKASAHSMLKTSHLSRNSHSSSSKHNTSDAKELVLHPSSKASITQNVATQLGSAESASALQAQSASDLQTKTSTSGFSQKAEKSNHPLQSSKANHSSSMHPPAVVNSSTTLSDEELALLLHQELNSSPRVPRVPRVRQGSTTPQLASPPATSMLIKCSSSSGGKDNSSVPRRKGKEDAPRDGFRNSRENINETKKVAGSLSSPHRKQDPVLTSDGPRKREACSPSREVGHPAKKNIISTNPFSPSSSAEASDQNLSSIGQSPMVNSDDDDAGRLSGRTTRTLPGLIAEIMSSGRRMTYEELCNAVLPHWHKLRKHNGERYAYSTHSQAVLDCLRNRSEWAQLVDRGPKTNGGGRKRRKLDSDLPLVESEENEYVKGRISKEFDGNVESHSHREDFPKGKRKARKRRRLALQGRGIKDVRKRRKADGSTDDDDDDDDDDMGMFSHSSEEGADEIFSENDSRGARTCPVGTVDSPSSNGAGSM